MYVNTKQYESLFQKIKSQRKQHAISTLKKGQKSYQGKTMRFSYYIHGKQPANGYRLVFGLHGGGNCASDVNQHQYCNHKHLYDGLLPQGTIWVAVRSAQEASDMWWKSYVPQFIQFFVQCFTALGFIDNNRVFITGYSAGGDGVYHLGDMMADQLAGAAMMAGHPNNALIWNLRNIAFSVQTGELDHAYDRSNWCKAYIEKLNQFSLQFGGFRHYSLLHQNKPHWMGKQDAKIFPNFLNQIRNPYPNFILFKQHERTFKKTFYYIKIDQKHEGIICVRKNGNRFEIQSNKMAITVMLNRNFVNFSQDIEIYHNGELTVRRKPEINKNIVSDSMYRFFDPWYIFEDQIISVPSKQCPNQHPFRPFEMLNRPSNIQKVLSVQKNIIQGKSLQVVRKQNPYKHESGSYKGKQILNDCMLF